MRNLLIMIGGFFVGAAAVTSVLVALPTPANDDSQAAAPAAAASSRTGDGMTMSGSRMAMSGSSSMASSSLASAKLTIQHVQKGCHVWAMDGKTVGAITRLHLKPGQKLSILDQDVDAHQLMELAGPAHLHMSGPMMPSHGMTLMFVKKGVYQLGTKTVEMAGMGGMDVKTIGPDNHLRLLVTVA